MVPAKFSVEYPGGLHVCRDLTEARLREFVASFGVRGRDVGTGWVWYRLPSFLDGALNIGMQLGFNRGSLREMTIFHDAPDIFGNDWNDWSAEKEQLRAENTRAWFEQKGFPVGQYPWGEVWSCFDTKSGFGSGGVRYAP